MVEESNLPETSLYILFWGNISSKFSNNSEADASELLENRDEMSLILING